MINSPGVPHILFAVTDGGSDSESNTIAAAKSLHRDGITMFAIGVGNVRNNELRAMASSPTHLYNYDDYNKLSSLQNQFIKETCKSKSVYSIMITIALLFNFVQYFLNTDII